MRGAATGIARGGSCCSVHSEEPSSVEDPCLLWPAWHHPNKLRSTQKYTKSPATETQTVKESSQEKPHTE
eukprot:3889532-Amphidinium_carterae.1